MKETVRDVYDVISLHTLITFDQYFNTVVKLNMNRFVQLIKLLIEISRLGQFLDIYSYLQAKRQQLWHW